MQKIKTISFDLWNTLIKSNPEFKKERNFIISKYCNFDIETINSTFNNVKKDLDGIVEKFGISFTSEQAYAKVFNILNIDKNKFRIIKNACDMLFIEHLPLIISNTENILDNLSKKYELVISSNTLFVSSAVLKTSLEHLRLDKYFHHMYFSDKLGVSKPHINFFKEVHINSTSLINEILHVGDNTITDIAGASEYGFEIYEFSKLYNNNINTLYTELNK